MIAVRPEFFIAHSAKASLRAFIKAYERRRVVEVTPTMVTAGMRALRAGLQDTAERVFQAMMRGQPPLDVTPRMKQTAAELMFIRLDFYADRLAAESACHVSGGSAGSRVGQQACARACLAEVG